MPKFQFCFADSAQLGHKSMKKRTHAIIQRYDRKSTMYCKPLMLVTEIKDCSSLDIIQHFSAALVEDYQPIVVEVSVKEDWNQSQLQSQYFPLSQNGKSLLPRDSLEGDGRWYPNLGNPEKKQKIQKYVEQSLNLIFTLNFLKHMKTHFQYPLDLPKLHKNAASKRKLKNQTIFFKNTNFINK